MVRSLDQATIRVGEGAGPQVKRRPSLPPPEVADNVTLVRIVPTPVRAIMTARCRIPRLWLFATVLCVAATASASAQDAFTIEQVLAAPFPTELVAAPQGAAFAWVQYDRGTRNIWMATGPSFEGQPVTNFSGDDGQVLTDLVFTHDGENIVFVRGSTLGFVHSPTAPIPNPTSDPEGTERALWVVEVATGNARRLAEGSAPAPSPDGNKVAFLRGGQIWMFPTRSADDPSQLLKIRGSATQLAWSPDGNSLAFKSSRGDHSFIGVVHIPSGTLRYFDPSFDHDGSPVWSPDGTRIAYARVPNLRGRVLFEPVREAVPWSIRVVDLNSGEAHTIFEAPRGVGSAYYARNISSTSDIFWGSGNRIVFPWEGTGWVNLYSVPAGGGEPTPLTPGEFEVQHVSSTPSGDEVLYVSNEGDIDRQHVWRVGVDGGQRQHVTPGSGLEWSPVMAADGGAIAFLASAGTVPAHPAVVVGGQRSSLTPDALPDDFPTAALVEPQQVVFSGSDGLSIHGQLFLPEGSSPGDQRPAMLHFHGGSRSQMLLGFHHSGYYHNAYAFNQYLVRRGYVVLSVNYRSGTGYGMEFREAPNYGATGASEFLDVMGAGLYLKSRADVDGDRIGLWGGSYGGYLTALGLARASDLFAAGVDIHGVHNWNITIQNFTPSYNPEARPDYARVAFESSPMADVDTWSSPVLLISGDDDRNVPFRESVDLAQKLRERGVHVEQLVFPDEIHGFLLHSSWVTLFEAAADFLKRELEGT